MLNPPAFAHSAFHRSSRLWAFYALACVTTWALAAPTQLAWSRGEAPSPLAVTGAGLSAFGPLIATALACERGEWRAILSRWRTPLGWLLLALCAPLLVHFSARLLYVAVGGQPASFFYWVGGFEGVAALVVFPLGEEIGWRGFAYPRVVERWGLVKGTLALGLMWGFWHLGYNLAPGRVGLNLEAFGLALLQLPLYSLILTWLMERGHRSYLLAIAFHAAGHLDHLERDPATTLTLQACHLAVLVIAGALAARSLSRLERVAAKRPARAA